MAITYIDFYAENPIENKTIADSCIFENINGDGNALWTIYNSNDITITAEDTLYLNADRMWFNSSVEWTTIVSNSGMGFTTNPNSSGYSFTWNANGGIWDVDTKGGDVRFNTYNSTSATYGTMIFPPVDKLQIAGGTNGQVLTTNGSGVLSWTTVSGGGVSDGDKGDITVSGSGSVWTIDNSVVTYGKMQDASGHSVLGRSANTSGAIGEITSSANGQVLHRNGSNLVFGTIGDSSITNSSITYSRLQDVSTNNRLLGRSTAGAGSIEEITVGSGLSLSAGTLSASGGGGGYQIQVDTFTTSGTWTKPTFAKQVKVYVLSGGAGGGSGARRDITSGRSGGGGGAGNCYASLMIEASALASTVPVTVGAGGTGGASVSVNDTNGNSGVAGGASSFGGYIASNVPTGGGGGTTSSGASGLNENPNVGILPTGSFDGRSGQTSTGLSRISSFGALGSTGGGGGAGASASSTTTASGGEWKPPNWAIMFPLWTFGTIGTNGGAGGNGANNAFGLLYIGTGGGGGSYKTAQATGAGGNGGYGAGGGGGAGSDNNFASGAGGNGGNGLVIVVSEG